MTKTEQHQYALQNDSITYGLPYDGGSIMHYHSSHGTDFKSLVKIEAYTLAEFILLFLTFQSMSFPYIQLITIQ